jgi:hypothetical protein
MLHGTSDQSQLHCQQLQHSCAGSKQFMLSVHKRTLPLHSMLGMPEALQLLRAVK